jgi:NADPH:quinone reductase-like Zn-dependent oxidoreductase
MKIAVLWDPRQITIEEREINSQTLAPNQIFVETELTAFKIGTDRGNYEGAEQVPGAPDYPRGVGDSNVGIVKTIGSSVMGFKVGDRVVSRAPRQSEWIGDEKDSVVKVPDGVEAQDAVWAHLYTLSR